MDGNTTVQANEGAPITVGDGNPLRVAGEIVKHMLSAAEKRLGIDDPVLGVEVPEN